MSAFGSSMFPGQKLGKVARDEDSEGEGHRLPAGPLDLDAGVVEVTPRQASDEDDDRDD